MDRISGLPDAILTSILTLLPIKEAARTSILANRWRFLWLTIPHLELGYSLGYDPVTDAAFTGRTPFPPPDPNRWLAAATQILLSRSQFLHIFPLQGCKIFTTIPQPLSGPFDAFIRFLSGNRVVDFHLHNGDQDSLYRVPKQLFFSRSLSFLTLHGCIISPPTSFSGLAALRSLDLFSVLINDDELDHILNSCPYLKDLRLTDCYGLTSVTVQPSVQTFVGYNRPTLRVDLEHPDKLVFFGLSFWTNPEVDPLDEEGMNMLDVLMGLGDIESLCLRFSSGFGECLQMEEFKIPSSLPDDRLLVNLKKLDVEIPLADGNLIMILPCLLESSPNLQELRIKDDESESSNEVMEEYWMKQKNLECLRNHISTIRYHETSRRPWKFEKELVCLQLASPYAELDFKPFDKSEL